MSIPDETHEDLIESFFILEGNCTCMVNGFAHHLSPGDFLETPLPYGVFYLPLNDYLKLR